MSALPTITPLPDPPSRQSSPDTFADDADTFIAALPTFVQELNDFGDAVVNANYKAASATSRSIGTGSKSFVIETGKNFTIGQFVVAASSADPSKYMFGQVTAHDDETGDITVNVLTVGGSGTFADWVINLAGAPGLTDASDVVFTPTGGVSASNAQDAIAEVDSEKLGGALGSTDNAILRADGTAGKTGQGSSITIDDAGKMTIPGATPELEFYESDQGTDTKRWRIITNNGNFNLQALSDDGGSSTSAMQLQRSAATVNLLVLGAPIRPNSDDSYDIGTASFRYDDVYATNGTIQTSDGSEKHWIGAMPIELKRALRNFLRTMGGFKWLSAIADKGELARIHYGGVAQDLIRCLRSEGLDPFSYAMVCANDIVETVQVDEKVTVRKVPVVYASGPRKGQAKLDQEGNALFQDVEVRVPIFGDVPVIDPETSKQKVRYGIRYNELISAMLVVIGEEQDDLLRRFELMEGRR